MTVATHRPHLAEAKVPPVAPGLAEQLARIARFRSLEDVQPEELDEVAHWLLGPVGDRSALWEQLQPECTRLWFLITDDWDDRDLDDIPEADWARYSFATQEKEEEHRYAITRDRLCHDIESAVQLARLVAAERSRTAVAR